METFKDEGHEGTVTLVFGGKVLVVDIDFSVDRTNPLRPSIRISNVKTSYAIPGAESNTEGSNSLDAFLCHSMQAFCIEIQRPEAELDPLEAARLGIIINDHLQYLVVLDRFAERKGEDGGLRWFVEVDALCRDVEVFASAEAKVIASFVLLLKRLSCLIKLQLASARAGAFGRFPPESACSTSTIPQASLDIISRISFPRSISAASS